MDANRSQSEYWQSPAGLAWITHEEALDAAMAGMLGPMFDAAAVGPGDRLLDIGCGTGASTLEAARRVPKGEVVALDISAPLLARARERAHAAGVRNVTFLHGDAQSHAFAPEAHDALVSRIGMSFFADPAAAFRNLRRALRPGGRMSFTAWARAAENPWFEIPRRAAEARLGPAPASDPHAPGPTAFADSGRVVGLMAEAGLADTAAHRLEIVLTPPGTPEAAARAASRVGPAARIMKAKGGTPQDAAAIEEAVRAEFTRFETAAGVRVPAVVLLFVARA